MPSKKKVIFELRWYNENLAIQTSGGIASKTKETEVQKLWDGNIISVFEKQQGKKCSSMSKEASNSGRDQREWQESFL